MDLKTEGEETGKMSAASGRKGGEARIPFYTGKPGDDFGRWLQKFEMGARAMQWNNLTKLAQIPTFFTEIAESRWHRINKNIRDSFTLKEPPDEHDIVVHMRKMFEDKGERERNARKLFDVKQGKVSVVEYMNELEETASKAYPDNSITESLMKDLFMRGLRVDLRSKVEYKNPNTLDEMFEEAMRFEALRNCYESEKGIGKSEIHTLRHETDIRHTSQCFNCGQFGHLRYVCPYIPMMNTEPFIQPSHRKGRGCTQRKYFDGKHKERDVEREDRRSNDKGPAPSSTRSVVNQVSPNWPNYTEAEGPASIVKIQVEGVRTIALIDSGATVSVISDSLAGKLPKQSQWVAPSAKANSVSGHQLTFSKASQMTVMIGNERVCHKMHVLDGLPYPCILGTDIMRKIGVMSLDFRNSTISIGNKDVLSLIPHEEVIKQRARNKVHENYAQINLIAHKTQMIEPWAQTCVWVTAKEAEDGKHLIIDDRMVASKLVQGGILLARSLGTVKDGKIPVTFLNTSLKGYPLYEKASVGKADIMDEAEINLIGHISHAPVPHTVKDPLAQLDLSKSDLSVIQRAEMSRFLRKHAEVFSSGTENPGQTHRVSHKIDTGNSAPLHVRAHRTPFSKREKIKKMVEDMVDAGIARPSSSPWSSPIVLAKKKSGEDRFCVDYRRLNDITKKDTYPLPKISELLDSLGKSKYFSTLDLAKGYWQIPMNKEDREKTAFITPEGLYEFNVMPFGLTNAPATFQRTMDIALTGLQWESCLVYMDDIIVYTETFENHLQTLGKVFERLRNFNLKLNLKKCHFAKSSVLYLGHIVSKKGIQPDPKKTEMVEKFPVPKSVKQLEKFLGLASYYRRFVKGFATIAAPLDALKKKDVDFTWTEACQQAFDTLRMALMTPPVLAFPDFKKPFLLETDASGTGIGGILSQEVWDAKKQRNVYKPVAYASHKLSKSEINYHATEREALAILWALKYFKPYVYGTPVKLVSDHAPLQWLMSNKNPTGRLARWAVQLQEYDLVKENGKLITYKPGKSITHVDACSRIHEVNSFVPTDGSLHIGKEQRADAWCKGIITKLERGWEVPGYFIHKEVLHHCPRHVERASLQFPSQIVIPQSLREGILELCHDNLFGGHMGCDRTYDRLAQRYYWEGMRTDCEHWVASCKFCQQRKGPVKANKEMLVPIVSKEPFAKLVVDVLGPLPITENGNKYIVIFTDHFSKYVEAFALPNHTAKTIAQVFVSKVVCRHGAPCELLSDQGPEFMSALVSEICKLCDVKKLNSTAYHPQTQGLTERFNRTIIGILQAYVNRNQSDWDTFIPFALWAYHTSKQKSLNESPFYMMYGRDSRMPSDIAFQAKRPVYVDLDEDYKEKTIQRFSLARELAQVSLGKAQNEIKREYDKGVSPSKISPGDSVSLFRPAVPLGSSPKLWVHWQGPFRVLQVKTPTVLIEEIGKDKPSFWVHMTRVKPFNYRYEKDRPKETGKTQGPVAITPEQRVNFGHYLRSGKSYGISTMSCPLRYPREFRRRTR